MRPSRQLRVYFGKSEDRLDVRSLRDLLASNSPLELCEAIADCQDAVTLLKERVSVVVEMPYEEFVEEMRQLLGPPVGS